MLNCKHFETCLSSCLSPRPPDPQCPLEMVREVSRKLRHTSDCKVTDTDLQDYFQKLTTLLSDPLSLWNEPSARDARVKLSDLLNDRLSLDELGALLRSVNQTLNMAESTISRTLAESVQIIDDKLKHGIQTIQQETQHGVKYLKDETLDCQARIEDTARDAEHKVTETIQDATKKIELETKESTQKINDTNQQCIRKLEQETQHGIEKIEQAKQKRQKTDYNSALKELIKRMKAHYCETLSHVSLSVLDPQLDKPLQDLFVIPNIYRVVIEADGKRTNKDQIYKYKDLFHSGEEVLNRHIFLQGEPGVGKSTFAAKLVLDWCNEDRSFSTNPEMGAFDDLETLRQFNVLFFIALRNSGDQTDVTEMIKSQIIDMNYAKDERENAYKLLLDVIQHELCLVVEEGIDEWVDPDNKLVLPSMAGFPKERSIILYTTRPWKMTDERIKNSQIDLLIELTGITDSEDLSRRILKCISVDDLNSSVEQFKCFIKEHGFQKIILTPMMLTIILLKFKTGLAERLTRPSLCKLYSVLLESLCKKANDTKGYFLQMNAPQCVCFENTEYIEPNIKEINELAKAAFYLRFSMKQKATVVFSERELAKYINNYVVQFALKTGILLKRRVKSRSDRSYCFIHLSFQDFLAAYYMANNMSAIENTIQEYLDAFKYAFYGMAPAFIFLCGIHIDAANKLSILMDANKHHFSIDYVWLFTKDPNFCIQNVYINALKEAKSSGHKDEDIHLKLSSFDFTSCSDSDRDALYCLFLINKSNVISLRSDNWDSEGCDVSYLENLETLILYDPADFIPRPLPNPTKLTHLELSNIILCSSLQECFQTLFENYTHEDENEDTPSIPPTLVQIVLKLPEDTCSQSWLRRLFKTILTFPVLIFELRISNISVDIIKTGESVDVNELVATDTNVPCLFDAIRNSKVTDLCVDLFRVTPYQVSAFLRMLPTLTNVETLKIISDKICLDIKLPQSVKCVKFDYLFTVLSPSEVRFLLKNVMFLQHLKECKLKFGYNGGLHKYETIKKDLDEMPNIEVSKNEHEILNTTSNSEYGLMERLTTFGALDNGHYYDDEDDEDDENEYFNDYFEAIAAARSDDDENGDDDDDFEAAVLGE
ncbi:uncharacterized protein LOC127864605 [Dreissena polymorpha]|uniref:NACHT domain-containing protein n=1 Tax=Dreissena polymorpha TaxID=45954 RepID=A0A9D4SA54_DREPO|nr:uncharacterized protein LOC127864605 [Dreissena polymorpha]KAH3897481.1 hypothetical protein DPMN_021669 [Dreissena polymorpha]